MELKYFGTDGIRGSKEDGIATPEFFKKVGAGLGRYLRVRHPSGPVHIVVGRDTRASGKALEDAFVEGIKPYGIDLDILGVVPTPAVSYWIDELEADNGIVITASHNPASDNGIKFFNAHGKKHPLDKEELIDQLIDADSEPEDEYKDGEIIFHEDAVKGYVSHVQELMAKGTLKGWKIVLDTANGATFETSKQFFENTGAELIQLGGAPDGENINDGVGSEFPELLGKEVLNHQANIGIAHDGDGDRLVVVDEEGQLVPGEQLMGILVSHAKGNDELNNDLLVTTIQSNTGLDKALKDKGIRVFRCDIGDRSVTYAMLKEDAMFGGEPSGHFIFRDNAKTGDGLIAAVKVIQAILDSGKRLADLRKEFPLFPQVTVDLKVKSKVPLDQLSELSNTIAEIKESLGDSGRVLVRYSGTESKLRILVEAEDEARAAEYASKLKAVAEKEYLSLV